jgi:hypothetical protein
MRTVIFLLFVILAWPAWAGKSCVIIYANDVPWSKEVYWHEMAHANGWKHPKRPAGAAFKKGYKAYQPPRQFLYKNKSCIVRAVSAAKAKHICGSYGCQWFE